MDETKRGVIIIDVFGDNPDEGFVIVSSESDDPPKTENLTEKTREYLPELQIVPSTPRVEKSLPILLPILQIS